MAGRNRCRCSPSLYKSCGGILEVQTSVTPRRNRPANKSQQDHGVGDVRDEELIQANHAHARCNARRHQLQWITAILDAAQPRVDLTHESIEMHALSGASAQRLIKQIHQQGLAAAHAAPEIKTANRRDGGAVQERWESRAQLVPPGLRPHRQLRAQLIEPRCGLLLNGVEFKSMGRDVFPQARGDGLGFVRQPAPVPRGSGSWGPNHPRVSSR